jgi:hypothetical protein
MKKIFQIICVTFLIVSCSTEKQGNMVVSGTIKNLKKGTLLLQKVKDSTIVTVDSIALLNKNTFLLSDDVDSPQLYYLTFDGNSTKKSISFFGEKGNIIINSETELFDLYPEISGSENQRIYEEFLKVNSIFSNRNLDFIKREFDYKKDKKIDSLQELQKEYSRFIRRKYLYVTNFAINNKNYEVAPFLALTQLNNANVKLLDTINNSLAEKVKQSLYGKKLNEFIKQIKELETE